MHRTTKVIKTITSLREVLTHTTKKPLICCNGPSRTKTPVHQDACTHRETTRSPTIKHIRKHAHGCNASESLGLYLTVTHQGDIDIERSSPKQAYDLRQCFMRCLPVQTNSSCCHRCQRVSAWRSNTAPSKDTHEPQSPATPSRNPNNNHDSLERRCARATASCDPQPERHSRQLEGEKRRSLKLSSN